MPATVPPEVMQRAVEDWFSSEFGERAKFAWTSHASGGFGPTYYEIAFDTWLDYAMPFCPFEYSARHHGPEMPAKFLREANKMQARFERMLDALGWRATMHGSGLADGSTCTLKFFPNNATDMGHTIVWAGSAWWPDNEPFVTVAALDRRVLTRVLREHVELEAVRAADDYLDEFDEEEIEPGRTAVIERYREEIRIQEDRYELRELVSGRELQRVYEAILTEGYALVGD